MAKIPADEVFKCNYTKLEDVIKLANRMAANGPPLVVYKYPGRRTYSITLRSRTDLYLNDWVVHRT